jgi:hypothetical protein
VRAKKSLDVAQRSDNPNHGDRGSTPRLVSLSPLGGGGERTGLVCEREWGGSKFGEAVEGRGI